MWSAGHVFCKDVTIFHGIPFAAPPLGPLRWRLPQEPANWTKPISMTRPAYVATESACMYTGTRACRSECPQFEIVKNLGRGEEDCLYLSVYVPQACTTNTPCAVRTGVHARVRVGAREQGTAGHELRRA